MYHRKKPSQCEVAMNYQNDDSELREFKRNINLAEFIARDGYYVDKKKSSRNCIVLKNGHETILVGVDKDTQHHFYTNLNNPQDKGSIIDYIQNRENLSLGQIRQKLRGSSKTIKYYINQDIPSIIEPSSKKTQEFSEIIESLNTLKTSLYLENRGITQETLNSRRFAGTILTDKFGNAIFPHRDTEGYCGYEIRNNSGKFFSKGGTKGLWFSKFYTEDKTLVICESQIDALSHYQIHQDPYTRYITTSGSLSHKQKELISIACEKIGERIDTVVLAADNDSAGQKQNEEIKELITNMKTKISRPQNSKDWNELLMSQKRTKQDKSQKKQMQK